MDRLIDSRVPKLAALLHNQISIVGTADAELDLDWRA
jgi:hypothetical protein